LLHNTRTNPHDRVVATVIIIPFSGTPIFYQHFPPSRHFLSLPFPNFFSDINPLRIFSQNYTIHVFTSFPPFPIFHTVPISIISQLCARNTGHIYLLVTTPVFPLFTRPSTPHIFFRYHQNPPQPLFSPTFPQRFIPSVSSLFLYHMPIIFSS